MSLYERDDCTHEHLHNRPEFDCDCDFCVNREFVAELDPADEHILNDVLGDINWRVKDKVRYLYSRIDTAPESNLEARMGVALCFEFHDHFTAERNWTRDHIYPQYRCPPFRLDLLIHRHRGDKTQKLGVECDGDLYHTKPYQIARDSWRDKLIREQHGIHIVRFSSAQIRGNPKWCASTAFRILCEQPFTQDAPPEQPGWLKTLIPSGGV